MQCVISHVAGDAVLWSRLLHLLLCTLLLAQQPSVLLRDGRWLQPTSVLDPQGPGDEGPLEEVELHALGSTCGARLKALARSQPDERPARPARWRDTGPHARCCDTAEAHWREALLPRRSPLDDEPPEPA
jgi:hypothetical protein